MVKREQVIRGTLVKVTKNSPAAPGPTFQGALLKGDLLSIQGIPFKSGGLNLVSVCGADGIQNVYYAFITNFCTVHTPES